MRQQTPSASFLVGMAGISSYKVKSYKVCKMKNYLIALIGLVIAFLACYQFWTVVKVDNIDNIAVVDDKYIKIAGQTVKVDLALTPEEHAQGLSGRAGLAENTGMLFVFKTLGKHSFWMKDMNFAIDMIWVSEDLKVIYVKENASPESYPEIFGPEKKTKYVLEVPAGFSERHNLKIGDKAEFTWQ